MSRALAIMIVSGLLIAGCGPRAIALPDDPIASAATCGVVAAAKARAAQADIKAPLSMAAQGDILRHALVVGARTPEFAQADASAVIAGMSERAGEVTDSDWQALIEPCDKAFPPPPEPAKLPDDPYVAGLGCDALGRFMRAALASDGRYEAELSRYNKLETALDTRIAPLLAAHGKSGTEAAQAEKRKAMSSIVKLGRPDQLMDACVARYDSDG